MKKKQRRLLFWRILLVILIICNMAVVYMFSSHNRTKSASISQRVTIAIIELISKFRDDEKEATTTEPVADLTTPIEELTSPDPITSPSEDQGDDDVTTPSQGTDETDPPDVTGGTDEPNVTDPIDPPVGEEETTPSLETDETEGTDVTEPEDTSTAEETTTVEEVTTPEPEIETEPPKKDPLADLTPEQVAMVNKAHTPVRKLAHMAEFGSLAALMFLFLLTWNGKFWWRYLTSLGFALAYAVTDELHQMFSDGRGARLSDVYIDFTGAFITCTLLLTFFVALRISRRLVTTRYDLPAMPDGRARRLALIADLHACPHEKLVERLRAETPDMILLAGDIMEDDELTDEWSSGYAFLRECAAIAPTYYALGNHETVGSRKKGTTVLSEETRARIAKTGVTLLHNESVLADGIRICGLTSGLTKQENRPDEAVLAEFASAPEYRILLCHHPEYYEPYIRSTNIDLVVSGHAHGGQWRFFGQGVYAPGQGIFPKHTAGVTDSRLVITRGAGDHTRVPRIGNPRELVIIRTASKNESDTQRKGETKCLLSTSLSRILKKK